MSFQTYMLDTCICSYIIRENPISVLYRLNEVTNANHPIVISAVTYAEMQFGVMGKKASPKHAKLVLAFLKRVDDILPWDVSAVDATVGIKKALTAQGTPIGPNNMAIAGHAIAVNAILVTNNTREFQRVPDLQLEDWSC